MRKDWQTVKLGEVAEIRSSKRIFRDEYSKSGVPFYRGKEISELSQGQAISTTLFITEEHYNQLKRTHAIPAYGDILLTSVGTIGNAYMVSDNKPFYFKDGNITWIRNYSKDLYNRFLLYWIRSPMGESEIKSKLIGSTQQALTIDAIKSFNIPLPPLEEQERIARILSAFDDKIEVNSKICKDLEALAKLLFNKHFTANPDKDSWPVAKLGEVAEIVGGGTPSTSKPEYWDGNIPWLTPRDFSNNPQQYWVRGERNITELGFQNSSARKLPKGTILFTSRAPIGYIGIANCEITTNQGFKSVIVGEKLNNIYVYYFLKHITPYIKSIATGSTFLEVSGTAMKNIEFPLPPAELLAQFEAQVAPLFAQIKELQHQNAQLALARDLLLPRLMRGEV
ncbi:MAG: restriction endonuclease subunit S [Brevinema sp.]